VWRPCAVEGNDEFRSRWRTGQDRLYRSSKPPEHRKPDQDTEYRPRAGASGGLGEPAADHAGARASNASRSSGVTTRSTASRPMCRRPSRMIASPRVLRSPKQSRNKVTHGVDYSAGRLRSTIRTCLVATPARWTGSRMARSPKTPNSATTASPPIDRQRRQVGVTVAYVVRACSRNTCCRKPCRGYVQPSRYGRRHWISRGASGEMSASSP